MDIRELLAALGQQIGENLDKSNDSQQQNVDLIRKKLQNPGYTPSPEEESQDKEYYNSMIQAVAGSLNPTVPLKGVKIAEELANRSTFGQRATKAVDKLTGTADLAEKGAGTLTDVAMAQQAANRALDAKERFAKQLALRKMLNR